MSYRYLPNYIFPSVAYLPGKGQHPRVEAVYTYFRETEPQLSEGLRASIDLFNFHYYWESHVALEALWNQCGRKGTHADFLKSLIHVAACGIKIRLGKLETASRHLKRAIELLEKHPRETILGFKLDPLLTQLKLAQKGPDLTFIELKPEWT